MFKILSQSAKKVDGQPVTLMAVEILKWQEKDGTRRTFQHTRHLKRRADGLYHAIISPVLEHVFKLVDGVLEYVSAVILRAEAKKPTRAPKSKRHENVIPAQHVFPSDAVALGVAV